MRLIGVLDYQLVQTELRQDRGEQRLVRLVQTQPNDPAVAACNGADFLDRDIAYPLAVTVNAQATTPGREISAVTVRSSISQRP